MADVIERKPDYLRAAAMADKLTNPYSAPPVPVLEVAEQNGVNVIFADFDEYSDRVAGLCDFSAAEILVNKDDYTSRQMFTIAHELGHWMLHRDHFLRHPDLYPVLPRFQKTLKKDPFEQEANAFAANLLVPKRLLLPLIGAPIAVLARIFAVSQEMMEYRVKDVRR